MSDPFEEPVFRIFLGKGFQIRFNNGWMISVQFGDWNYCANRLSNKQVSNNGTCGTWECKDAEVAARDCKGRFLKLGEHDDVKGWVSPDDVAELILMIQGLPKDYLDQFPDKSSGG